MTLYLRIRTVDMNGYLGREHHPEPSDVGLRVRPIALSTVFFGVLDYETLPAKNADTGDTFLPTAALPFLFEREQNAGDQEGIETCWTCVTEDGRLLELMDFEVEPETGR